MKVVQMKKISRKLNLKIKQSHSKHIGSFNIKCPVLGCFGNLLAVQQFHHHLKRNFHKFLAPHSNTSNTFWTLEAMLFNCFVWGKIFYLYTRSSVRMPCLKYRGGVKAAKIVLRQSFQTITLVGSFKVYLVSLCCEALQITQVSKDGKTCI